MIRFGKPERMVKAASRLVVLHVGERVELATFTGRGYIDRMGQLGTMLAERIAGQGAQFNAAFLARDGKPNPSMHYAFSGE